MLNRRSTLQIVLACAGMLLVTAIVLGSGRGISAGDSRSASQRTFGGAIIPAVQIIEVDNMVARFDSATGAVHVMQGDPGRGSGRVQWLPYVRGVGASTSGVLDIQQAHGVRGSETLFLVDVVRGDTWVLRDRGTSASWRSVNVRR